MYIAYHPYYNHPVPEGHRFPMQKYDDIYNSLTRLIPEGSLHIITPGLCDYSILGYVHTADYLEALEKLSLDTSHIRRIGFSLDQRIVDRERYIMQGTLEVTIKALEQRALGINIAGGTHHAFADRGEGFCILNDLAIAAAYLLAQKLCSKILIIDCDVHQGNGTAHIFQDNPHVFTFSIHGKNNFPFVKEHSDLDIELADGTGDEAYLEMLEQSLTNISHRFNPDFIFYQCGVDILATDKMGKLKVTPNGCRERDKMVFEFARKQGTPMVCTSGGGYSHQLSDVVDAHINTFMTGFHIFGNM